MKYSAHLLIFFVLLGSATSCKKVCYQCTQYCSYCEQKADSAFIVEVCSGNYSDKLRIDSVNASYNTSIWICNILNNQTEVCDGKNNIDQGITYYEQENYFCTPE